MVKELNERKNKIKLEINENQKNPEKIATNKGQNIQNIENTKKEVKNLMKNCLRQKKNII